MEINYFDSLLRARKEYARLLEPVCREYDLTRNEVDILLFLHNNPGLDRAADIVTHRGMAKSHVSLSVGTLEAKGLIARREDEADRRTIRLELTDTARSIADTARQAQRTFFGAIFAGVTPEEMETWRVITEKVTRNIENM